MNRAERIKQVLDRHFTPVMCEIVDESAKHAGHAGASPNGETHYKLTLVSDAFVGKSRITRHQMVYAVLKQEFNTGLHALSLDTKTSAELGKN